MASERKKHRPLPLVALLMAWLVPGAGHVYLGRTVRGVIIFVTISATFWAGVGIGGVMTADYQNERWWFMAEMFAGVHGLVAWHRHNQVQNKVLGGEAMRERLSLAQADQKLQEEGVFLPYPSDTVARAYAGVAGLLNLLCAFDAVVLAMMGATGEPPRTLSRRGPAEAEA